jgi:nitrite reductase (NADH) small subunit
MIDGAIDAEVEVHNVGSVDRIPLGEGRSFRIGCRDIAVFRSREGDLFATQAECPHRGGPLVDGLMGSGKVVCPLHGMTFDLTTGKPARATCEALRLYAVSLTETREVLIQLGSGR